MKSYTAIFLASLCLFAHATSVYEAPAFIELKSKPFGLMLTSLVEVNMSSHQAGNLDAISELLDTVAQSLNDQTETNENTILTQRGWCSSTLDDLNGQLTQAQTDLQDYEDEDSSLAEEEANDEVALTNEQNDLQTNKDNKDAAEQNLVDENSRNDQAVADYANAIAACQQSLSLLATLNTSPSGFLQAKASFGNVVALLEKHLANQSSSLVAPVITVLSELANAATEVDQDKLAVIVSLINQLLEELLSQQAANVVRHQNTVDELNIQINSLINLISGNEDTIDKLTTRLSAIADRRSQLVTLIGNLEVLIPILEGEVQSTENTCDAYETTYLEVKSTLDQETATLERVKEYFELHIVTSVENIDDSVYDDQLTV